VVITYSCLVSRANWATAPVHAPFRRLFGTTAEFAGLVIRSPLHGDTTVPEGGGFDAVAGVGTDRCRRLHRVVVAAFGHGIRPTRCPHWSPSMVAALSAQASSMRTYVPVASLPAAVQTTCPARLGPGKWLTRCLRG
jgi:hypothetical protein